MDLTVEQALLNGIAAQREGRLEEAENYYRAILQSQPQHPDANHNLGVLAVSMGKLDIALPLFKAALDSNPDIEQYWVSYISALIEANQVESALALKERAKEHGILSSQLEALTSKTHPSSIEEVSVSINPSDSQIQEVLAYYDSRQFKEAEELAAKITHEFPEYQFGWKIYGSVLNQLGKYSESVIAIQKSLRLDPNDYEAYCNMGNSLRILGELEEAAVSYLQSIAINPKHAIAHNNLGVTYGELGSLDKSEECYLAAIEHQPDYVDAYFNLGVVHQRQGRSKEAVVSYSKALDFDSGYAEAHNNLGLVHQQLGNLEDSEISYLKAISINPNYADPFFNLGNLCQELRKFDVAEANYRAAISIRPDYTEAYCNLGVALKALDRLYDSERSFEKAISLNPNNEVAHNNLGNVLLEQGKLRSAEASIRRAIALSPEYAEAHYNLGNTLQKQGRLSESVQCLEQATTLKPAYAEAYNNLGIIFQQLGELDNAKENYNLAIASKPKFAEAHRHLTLLKKYYTKDEQFLEMQELYQDKLITEEQRCHINFGLAKASEDVGEIEKAFNFYLEGNLLRKKLLGYQFGQDVELFNQLKVNSPRISKYKLQSTSQFEGPFPIFIVGMPRSGTTLVEQIISSHSQVTGAGELSFLSQYGDAITRGLVEIESETIQRFRLKYLDELQNVSNGKQFVTDKMPQNFLYIGLIAAAFPEAKIVHVNRDAAAVCWANFKQYFNSNKLGYCYSLDDIVGYFELYIELMKFWKNSFAMRIFDVDYELLTTEQEKVSRQLVEYLGLDWEKECLSPQSNRRVVATASNIQVREKIFQGSSQQWLKYRPFLKGKFDNLRSSYV